MAPQGSLSRRADARERERRRARWTGGAGFMVAAGVPAVAWNGLVVDIASEWRIDARYLLGQWTPWLLIALGLAFALPVMWSIGRDPESRWYPHARNAYAGWSVTLYLLGTLLAVQVDAIAGLSGG